jgi:hypothetical protein
MRHASNKYYNDNNSFIERATLHSGFIGIQLDNSFNILLMSGNTGFLEILQSYLK